MNNTTQQAPEVPPPPAEPPEVPPPPAEPPMVPPPPAEPPAALAAAPTRTVTERPGAERGGGHLPDWRTGELADLSKPSTASADEDAEQRKPQKKSKARQKPEEHAGQDELEERDAAEEPEDKEDKEEPEEDAAPRVAGWASNNSPGKGGVRASYVRGRADDNRLRIIAFNAAAAVPGLALGLVPAFGDVLPAAEQSAPAMLAASFAVIGAVLGWHLIRQPAVHTVLSHAALRLGAIAGIAELGRRSAPLAVTWLTEHGTPWGLSPSTVSLLVTVLAMCGGLYWLIDRPARAWHWVPRLIVRIPLASALLATALHTTGATT